MNLRAILFLFLFYGLSAYADCQIITPTSVNLDRYNPGDNGQNSQNWDFLITTKDECNFSLHFRNIQQGGILELNNGFNNLYIKLSKDQRGFNPLLAEPESNGIFQFAVEQKQLHFAYWMNASTDQWVSPGVYVGYLGVDLVDSDGMVFESREIRFQIHVDDVVHFNFGEINSLQQKSSVDFGQLEVHKSAKINIFIRANVNYSLSFISENAGNLQNIDHLESLIPYSMRINSQPYNLETKQNNDYASQASYEGVVNELEFTIKEFDSVRPGSYQDYITISIESK